jgi:glutathione S-transferase
MTRQKNTLVTPMGCFYFSHINIHIHIILVQFLHFRILNYTQTIIMSTYKLYYFNGRGRAEVSRLIFAAAGQKFEDIRFEQNQWPSHKGETPLGQVPVLEFDGTKLPQSITIARFLAKQFQLAGKDNLEQAKVDAVVDTITDLTAKYIPARIEQDEAKKKELTKKFLEEELPKHLQNLEVLGKLYGNGGPFFVGGHLTWADLYFYDVTDNLHKLDGNILNNYTWLKQNREEVAKQPKIAEHLKNRPETAF